MPKGTLERVPEGGAGRGAGGVARAVGRAWLKGWVAYVVAMGEPCLSSASAEGGREAARARGFDTSWVRRSA